MYYIGHDEASSKFILSFRDIEFEDAIPFLRQHQIYYDPKVRNHTIAENKIMDVISIFQFENVNFVLTDEAETKFKNILSSFKSEQEYFRRIVLDESILNDGIKLFDYQKLGIEFLLSRKRAFLADDAGLGKAQAEGTPVLTTNGWVSIEELNVGDLVFSSDGKSYPVTGVYPQGIKDIYKIYFSDHTSTNSCGDHLWITMNDNNKRRNQGWQVKPLKQIMSQKVKTQIPVSKPVEFREIVLPIHPYALGALIGDGYLGGSSVNLINPEDDIIDRVVSAVTPLACKGNVKIFNNHKSVCLKGYSHKNNDLLNSLRELNLNVKSIYKFIPEIYFRGSVEQRIDLLHGLMDTDGTVQVKSKGGCSCSFSTSSLDLAKDVRSLVLSLGGKTRLLSYKRLDGNVDYVVSVFLTFNPFWCKIKSSKWVSPTKHTTAKYFKEIIFSHKSPAYCISVDSPDNSYITEDYIVTHNTIQSIFTFSQLYKEKKIDRIFIIVRPGIAYNWKTEILTFVNQFVEEDILIVDNSNKKLLFDTHTDYKIYIIPNHLLKPIFLSYKKDADLNKSAKKIRWKSFVNLHSKLKTDKMCIIIDEAHELTNSQAISTKAILAHIQYFNYRYCLSATPTGNKWEKYFNGMELLDSGALGMSEITFKTYIAKSMGSRFDPYAVLSYNIDKVNLIKKSVIDFYYIKRLKEDLPEMKFRQIIKPIFFDISEGHKNLYRVFIQEEVNRIQLEHGGEITVKSILNRYPYLIQILDNPLLLIGKVENPFVETLLSKWNIEKDERFILLKSLIEKYVEEDGEKVVIFDGHPLTLDILSEKFKKYSPIVLHGQSGDDEKTKSHKVDLFNNDINYKLFITNPSVGGVGINLNKGSRRIIFFTLPFDAVLYEQSLGRTYRINNTNDSIVDILIADNSLDTLRYKRNSGRLQLNQKFLTKSLSKFELKNLLEMSAVGGNNFGN